MTNQYSTFIFSVKGQLVSYQSTTLTETWPKGTPFEALFPSLKEWFTSFIRTPENKAIPIAINKLSYIAFPHLMKDPSGTPMAIMLTLIPSSSKEPHINNRLVQMDRLAQVGQLAAGLAHEIRNPLAGISANIQVLQSLLDKDDERRDFTTIVIDEINRVEKIIKDLLDYSRQSPSERLPVQTNHLLKKLDSLVHTSLRKKGLELIIENEENLTIEGDSGKIIQLLLNLILNASQAMEKSKGKILVNCTKTKDDCLISIKDQGVGIPKEEIDKIFEPFYTTKSQGLGLGLSIVQSIAEEHQAKLEVESALQVGTEIKVYFPIETKSLLKPAQKYEESPL